MTPRAGQNGQVHVITDVPARPGRPDGPPGAHGRAAHARQQRVALVDLLDRVLGSGVVIVGDITLSVADVDMVTVSLRALISSASGAAEAAGDRLLPPEEQDE
jgi:hypothetical protein